MPDSSKMEMLVKFTSGISQEKLPDEQALYDYLVKKGSGVLNCHAATLFAVDSKKKMLTFIKSIGPVGKDLMGVSLPYKGVVGACAEKKSAILVKDTNNSQYFTSAVDKLSGFRTKNVIAVPVIADDVLIGVMEYINKTEGTFDIEDLQIAKIMADFISSCIARLWTAKKK